MAQQYTTYESFLNALPHVTHGNFEEIALALCRYQLSNNPIYHKYTGYLGIQPENITSLERIPFMPVDFFKHHEIKSGSWKPEVWFTSSGTTGQVPSRHPVRDLNVYLENTVRLFKAAYGDPAEYHFFGLLPSYLEREGSSLITMVEHFHQLSASSLGGFYLYDHEALLDAISQARAEGDRKIMLIGVTFALLDLAEQHPAALQDVIMMETGGMKGRRRELTREEIHQNLMSAFDLKAIHSEYGMTEMFSQAYARGSARYTESPTMKVLLRDPDDPLDVSAARDRGVINVIDLANIHSCAFLATDDLGRREEDGTFSVLGRIDNSDIRGCNLMVG